MAGRKATIKFELTTKDIDHPLRTIELDSSAAPVQIGRASNVTDKGFEGGPSNGWFASPVMSRHHAELKFDGSSASVLLRDVGSMHGTVVNEKKLAAHTDITLHDADFLEFGALVCRGTEKYPSCKMIIKSIDVRPKSQINIVSDLGHSGRGIDLITDTSSRGFSVPDPASSEDEIEDSDQYNSSDEEDFPSSPDGNTSISPSTPFVEPNSPTLKEGLYVYNSPQGLSSEEISEDLLRTKAERCPSSPASTNSDIDYAGEDDHYLRDSRVAAEEILSSEHDTDSDENSDKENEEDLGYDLENNESLDAYESDWGEKIDSDFNETDLPETKASDFSTVITSVSYTTTANGRPEDSMASNMRSTIRPKIVDDLYNDKTPDSYASAYHPGSYHDIYDSPPNAISSVDLESAPRSEMTVISNTPRVTLSSATQWLRAPSPSDAAMAKAGPPAIFATDLGAARKFSECEPFPDGSRYSFSAHYPSTVNVSGICKSSKILNWDPTCDKAGEMTEKNLSDKPMNRRNQETSQPVPQELAEASQALFDLAASTVLSLDGQVPTVPELDMTSAVAFNKSKALTARVAIDHASELHPIQTVKFKTPTSKRKAFEISSDVDDTTIQSTAQGSSLPHNKTTIEGDAAGVNFLSQFNFNKALSDVEQKIEEVAESKATINLNPSNAANIPVQPPNKRLKRFAEKLGYVALGGVAMSAGLFTALVATAPDFM